MFYTNEYSEKEFSDYEECRDDFLGSIDIEEYLPYIDSGHLLSRFFRRKSDTEFCNWLESEISAATDDLCNELIFEHEEDD